MEISTLASVMELFNNAWPAAVLALGLGSVFALILLIASIKLKVVVDPKIEAVQAALPGVDCGACGFAGCGSYAKAVVADPELLGKCAPGGAETSDALAGIL
ncbi:MAG: (Fe-S)-binding protein, partial [Planctomycetota bacterium]